MKIGILNKRKIMMKQLIDPQPGDYWHEMFSPFCLVVGRQGETVQIYHERINVDKGYWSWNPETLKSISLSEFKKNLSYNTIDGFHSDVIRNSKSMRAFVEYYVESLKV